MNQLWMKTMTNNQSIKIGTFRVNTHNSIGEQQRQRMRKKSTRSVELIMCFVLVRCDMIVARNVD